MRILMVHNYYQQAGGEDVVFAAETALLRASGHTVVQYTRHNDELNDHSRLHAAIATIWNPSIIGPLRASIRDNHIDVVHFHNIFPLISPAAYYAARREGVAVVQTLHNYRLLCLNAALYRNGNICEDCITAKSLLPGIQHACYRNNRAASAITATMVTAHRWLRTWSTMVDAYITFNEFTKQKLVAGGLPAAKLHIKPNFIAPDPGIGTGTGDYALFVGRLTEEKGVATLLTAWPQLAGRLPLKLIGDGPLAPVVQAAAANHSNIEWLGRKDQAEVRRLMGAARFLVVPSQWYETGGPLVILEALATGTPILSADLGPLANIADYTGRLFTAGDPSSMVAQVHWLLDHPDVLAQMRLNARAEFEAKYTAAQNVKLLLDIYEGPDPKKR